MNKLLIAALALGAFGFAQSAVSAPAASHAPGMIQTDDGLVQNARDRDWGLEGESRLSSRLGSQPTRLLGP